MRHVPRAVAIGLTSLTAAAAIGLLYGCAIDVTVVPTNDAEKQAIAAYDPEIARKNWQDFAQENGICEDGHAAKRCADWILKHMH